MYNFLHILKLSIRSTYNPYLLSSTKSTNNYLFN